MTYGEKDFTFDLPEEAEEGIEEDEEESTEEEEIE